MPLLFYCYFFIPLIYLPDLAGTTKALRFIVLTGIALSALAIYSTRQIIWINYQSLDKRSKIFLSIIALAILLTSINNFTHHNLAFISSPPEYLGLLAWLLFVVLGLMFSRLVKETVFKPAIMYMFGAAMIISLLYNIFYIRIGARVLGIMFQPTSMALYANIGAVIALQNLKKASKNLEKNAAIFVLLLCTLTVVLCQSRVGTSSLVAILIIWIFHSGQSRKIRAALLLLVVVIVAVHIVLPNYFSRFRVQSVNRGTTYRLNLYKTSANDLIRHNYAVGKGPATLPEAINNLNSVPEDIAMSLRLGFNFASTHDLFFDFAYYFGLLGALALIILNFQAVITYIKKSANFNLAYLLIFIILLLNAIFNTPSLELTALYFVVLFGLLASNYKPKHT